VELAALPARIGAGRQGVEEARVERAADESRVELFGIDARRDRP